MRNIGLCLLSFVFVLTMVPFIGAGDVKTGDEGWSADRIEISGSIDSPAIYLDKGITSILDAVGGTPVGLKPHQKSVFIWAPLITLNFKAEVADAVTAFVQLENRQMGSTLRWARVDTTGDGIPDADGLIGGGTADYVDFGGGDNIDMAVEQAYIKVAKFNGVDMTIGIQDLKFTLRDNEGAFFMDVSESENAWVPTMQEFFMGGLPLYKNTSEFAGLRFDYGNLEEENYQFCLFWGTVEETGVAHDDENLLGIVLDYKLPNSEKSKLSFSLNQISAHLSNMSIRTFGVGIDYFEAAPNLELYAEVYFQSGDYGRTVQADNWKTIDQDADAFRLGGKYTFVETTGKPWVDISYWMLSGDEDEATAKGQRENNNFVSYENSQSTLIYEGNLTGLDLDSNYTALKVELGITAEVDVNNDGTDEALDLRILFATFELNEDYKINQLKEDLGTEIDLVATLHYNKSVDFELAWASVTGADFFTKNGVGPGLPVQDEDDMTLVYFGTKIKF